MYRIKSVICRICWGYQDFMLIHLSGKLPEGFMIARDIPEHLATYDLYSGRYTVVCSVV